MFERSWFLACWVTFFLVILVDLWVFKNALFYWRLLILLMVLVVWYYNFVTLAVVFKIKLEIAKIMKFHACWLSAWTENHEIPCFQFCFIFITQMNNFMLGWTGLGWPGEAKSLKSFILSCFVLQFLSLSASAWFRRLLSNHVFCSRACARVQKVTPCNAFPPATILAPRLQGEANGNAFSLW